MTSYQRNDYAPNPLANASRNNAKSRGWGDGWPDPSGDFERITAAGVSVVVRADYGFGELIETLFKATEQRFGYDINPAGQVLQTWGFANRPIRGTNIASNHSWGLAVDINSLANPMQYTFKSDIPPEVVAMWSECGFYWGGYYANRKDAMHFEYVLKPSDVAESLRKAKAYLTSQPRPVPGKDTTVRMGALLAAARGTVQKDPDLFDAKQFFAFARTLIPALRAAEIAWNVTPQADTANRARLFSYAVKCVQWKARLPQDGVPGPNTMAYMDNFGWTIKKP